jgi:hypothetical protein
MKKFMTSVLMMMSLLLAGSFVSSAWASGYAVFHVPGYLVFEVPRNQGSDRMIHGFYDPMDPSRTEIPFKWQNGSSVVFVGFGADGKSLPTVPFQIFVNDQGTPYIEQDAFWLLASSQSFVDGVHGDMCVDNTSAGKRLCLITVDRSWGTAKDMTDSFLLQHQNFVVEVLPNGYARLRLPEAAPFPSQFIIRNEIPGIVPVGWYRGISAFQPYGYVDDQGKQQVTWVEVQAEPDPEGKGMVFKIDQSVPFRFQVAVQESLEKPVRFIEVDSGSLAWSGIGVMLDGSLPGGYTGFFVKPEIISFSYWLDSGTTAYTGMKIYFFYQTKGMSKCSLDGATASLNATFDEQSVQPTTLNHVIVCEGPLGGKFSGTFVKTVSVQVVNPPPFSMVLKSYSGFNEPVPPSQADMYYAGTNPNYYWNTSGASGCTLNGAKVDPNGDQTIASIQTGITKTLVCTDFFGVSHTATLDIKVVPKPIPSLTAGFYAYGLAVNTVYPHGSGRVWWQSTGLTACTLNGAKVDTNGNVPVGPFDSAPTFTVSCTDLDGANKMVSVPVQLVSKP